MVNVGKDGEEVKTVPVKCLFIVCHFVWHHPAGGLGIDSLTVDLPPINMNISSFTLAAKKARSLTQRG